MLATREVLAVILDGKAAPAITVRRPGLGGESIKVSLGMPSAEIKKQFGDDWDVELAHLFDVKEYHQLYRDLGLAVQYDNGVVKELVVAVVPVNESR
ncbi:MAG: hypothetical protein RLO18_17535 [Gimesia chilikensis]